jgi:DNA-directed RNA polymerase delta subunit
MNNNYDSFLEIAVALMKKKKKPQSLEALTKEVFSKKGVEGNELQIAQFQVDFMLSGFFVCCGEDKAGNQLWDLKTRQHSSLLDKDSGYMIDSSAEDNEAAENELKEEDQYGDRDGLYQGYDDDDDEDDLNEPDDIEDELEPMGDDSGDSSEYMINEDYIEEEDDEEEF